MYFDANVFANCVLRPEALQSSIVAACDEWLRRVSRGDVSACTSALTWDEVTWAVGRAGGGVPFDADRAALVGALLLEVPGLEFVDVNESILALANDLVRDQRFKPRDAIHVATAMLCAGGEIVTADGGIASRAASTPSLGLRVTDLRRLP